VVVVLNMRGKAEGGNYFLFLHKGLIPRLDMQVPVVKQRVFQLNLGEGNGGYVGRLVERV
jgi:hypothetical protein